MTIKYGVKQTIKPTVTDIAILMTLRFVVRVSLLGGSAAVATAEHTGSDLQRGG